MDLINQTPVVADVRVATLDGTRHRYGLLTAKATFTVAPDGSTALDTQAPVPLFEADEPTELGLLPGDGVPRQDRVFEVIALANAYGAHCRAGRAQMMVDMAVGSHHRALLVSGDRWWAQHAGSARISEPKPFDTLPLTWDRAYGGSAECWIDAESVIDLDHGMNKYGRGFDAHKLAVDVGKAFSAPAGFPRLAPDHFRLLPNLEHPQAQIQRWDDEPRPYCWATIPTDIGTHVQRAHDHMHQTGQPLAQADMLRMAYHRAHPDWIIDIPPQDAVVILRGMTASARWAFRIPRLRVLADYELGDRTGTRELEPQLLMLLPEQSRFYVVYRHFFTIDEVTPDMSRSFRLRLAEGWFQP
ncbi:DUF2169 domain-containing protein [Enhygromyxa salina]|uniref:DUF2169 domain-containing protein n=1 Tax=Enhygromyxa salina TaxID=215803 RepID=A0A2S9YTC6_9BACT|nr:DUF2169 domain-containing protein [Enhygromyxa salina]PRQ08289.1 hypothetical protein ENSA7_19120 [Enhygromyxa salina]